MVAGVIIFVFLERVGWIGIIWVEIEIEAWDELGCDGMG